MHLAASADSTTAVTTGTTPPAGATPFQVPIPQSGTISSEFPGEATFEFPDTLYDQLVAFYDRYASDFTDVVSGETFPDGHEWQVTDADQIYFIQLNLEPPVATLFIRVADN